VIGDLWGQPKLPNHKITKSSTHYNHQITGSPNPPEGGPPEDEATRPAAYRLPAPEQLPEISLTDDTRRVPPVALDDPLMPDVDPAAPVVGEVPAAPVGDVLEGFVDGGFAADVSPPLLMLDVSSVPLISTRWFTCFCRSSSFPLRITAPMLDELLALGLPAPVVPAVLVPAADPDPWDTSVKTNPLLPLERLALVLPGAPVDPVAVPVEPVPVVPAVPPFHWSALIRQPVNVTCWPLLWSRSL